MTPTLTEHSGIATLQEWLEAVNAGPEWLAAGTGLDLETVHRLLSGGQPLTAEIALRLERFLGGSAEIWLGLQAAYERDLQRPAGGWSDMEALRAAEAEPRQRCFAALPSERERLAAELAALRPYQAPDEP